MKIDKDALIKHRFWIMVGLSVPLSAVALLLLATTVSGRIDEARKQLTAMFKGLTDAAKNPSTPKDIAEREAEANVLVKEETKAWEKAFKQQEPDLRWPRA